MSGLFDDDSDADVQLKTDNEYAKQYNVWRKKEELNRLKTKYGEDESSSSSDDDDDEVEVAEQLDKDFFKTLACLKSKDPRIYDNRTEFFTELTVKKVKKKDQPVYLKDYERNLLLEKGGLLSDEEDGEQSRPKSPTYVEEQQNIKESFKKALDEVEEHDEDGDWGGLFKQRQKSKEEQEKEESDYIQWLAGQKTELGDENAEKELKPLKDYWSCPDLDEGEKFLKDYILNKRFLDKDNDDYIPTYDEIVHDSDQDDEETIEQQEEFEHKYNFRFEEPDQDFIKRYPRTMESSLRKKDDRRKIKRQEIKERKKKEKDEKMAELKKLQELKRKEIEEKLEKLKEITGNATLGFTDEDVEGDFDPEEYDRKMQELFNDEFYQGEEDEQKPQFPELDEELEIENWDRYTADEECTPHCEDENFNMDCDYDPNVETQKSLIESSSKSRKKRKRKSKFAEAVSRPKPKFDPNDKNYEQYFEEYYKLDCEDIIGDTPCRFKYRKVVPNDFGLTIEEILMAKERELNKWCSLKKTVQIRPEHVEKYDQIAYKKKAQNVNLKKKILPSLFAEETESKEEDQDGRGRSKTTQRGTDGDGSIQDGISENKGKKRKLENKEDSQESNGNNQKSESSNEKRRKKNNKQKVVKSNVEDGIKGKRKKSKLKDNESKKKFQKVNKKDDPVVSISDARLAAFGINPKKFKNKLKYRK